MRYQYKDGSYLPESSWSFFKIKKYTPHKSTRYINVDKNDNGILLPELYDKREIIVAVARHASPYVLKTLYLWNQMKRVFYILW